MQLRIVKYWNDPDDGVCSGPVEVVEMYSPVVIVRHEGDPEGTEFEVLQSELSEVRG